MKKTTSFILLAYLLFTITGTTYAQSLIDQQATKETKALYSNLHHLSKQHILFGHQDDLAYGVNWKYIPGKSDIKDVVNDYPAIYGWDIGRIELDSTKNIDGIPFSKMRTYIQDGYNRGAAITLSWHFNNPLTGGSSWDTTRNTIAAILPGAPKHDLFKSWLDKAAHFMHSLKGNKNEAIPLLFRPFHELTGNWFWWGKRGNTPEELKEIWHFTINYLRHEKKLHNLIIVYNTNDFRNEQEFLERYPGDNFADVLSFDLYQFDSKGKNNFIDAVKNQSAIATKIAKEKNKLIAFAETGFEAIPDPTWWTSTLWPAIKNYPLAYVLVWRNAGYMPSTQKMHYYGPFKGQQSASDFKKFYSNKQILFEKSIRAKKIYQ